MSTTIAHDFVALCKAGKFEEAGEKYWSPDVVSVEAMADAPPSVGIEAVRAKGVWWYANHEIHGVDVAGPYVNGDQFMVRFTMDVTTKASGQRSRMDEMGLYTLKGGKIAEERFFYAT